MSNLILLTDSYKTSHAVQYPPYTQQVFSYLESRGGLFDNTVFFGLQYFLQKYLQGTVITPEKIFEAETLLKKHGVPFNREGWMHIVKEHNGRLPVEIKAVPEGTVVPVNNALMTIVNTDPKCFWLTNYLETLLLQVWYPMTVATLSREMKKIIHKSLEETGDPAGIDFKLHDFGFRGVSSVESAGLGGAAHLVNFQGTDTLAALTLLNDYYGADCAGFSIPACYDEETEVLTSTGFKFFKDLRKTDLVAQFKDSGEIEFTNYSNYVESDYQGKMIKFFSKGDAAKIDVLVTPNHRMIRKSTAKNTIEVFQANDFNVSQRNSFIHAGVVSNATYNNLSFLDRLKIAFQADGAFASHKDDYTGRNSGCLPIRFSFKKDRKIERLKHILDNLEFDYTISEKNDKGYTSFWVKIPKNCEMHKQFSWIELDKISTKWAKEFIDELQYWDGTKKVNTIVYSSIIKLNVDIVSAIGVVANNRTAQSSYKDSRENRKEIHTVNISTNNLRNGKGVLKETLEYKGKIYCVTVPSGMLIVRRKGTPIVCGNSEHSTITSWGQEHEVEAFSNMLKKYPTGSIACVSDSYNIYKACEDLWGTQLKDQIMERNGTLIVRPDTGDPPYVVVKVLDILTEKFGYTINDKGYKVLPPQVRIIQGDGITYEMTQEILENMKNHLYSTDNVAFGMGGGLLQKVDRDTQKFAFKCSAINTGRWRDVFKSPVEGGKQSKKGLLVLRQDDSSWKTESVDDFAYSKTDNKLVTVFKDGFITQNYNLNSIRERAKL